ncbi:MAG: hypothetical protein Q9214_001116 [Letrouitia sp. 1 TL-2023]
MRICSLLHSLAALALLDQSLATPNLGRESKASNPVKLRPIKVGDFELATGIQRRDAADFSHLHLQTQAQLIYGQPGDSGQLLLANMTLYAPDGLQMVMMERFEPLTSSVDCKGDDGTMSLTFKSPDAFRHALETWSFINEAPEKKFLLIANHDGCGPDDERQPYLIRNIREDEAKLTTFLTAELAPWRDVGGTYDLDFGRAFPVHKPHERRGIGDIIQGNLDLSKSVTVPVNVGTPNQVTNIFKNAKGDFSIDCVNCFVAGSFLVTGHLSVHHFKLQSLTLDTSPQGFKAELELGANVTAGVTPDTVSHVKNLFSAPIPEAGIEISKFFKLGAIVDYDIGVSSTFSGKAAATFGLSASLPDSAKLTADIKNPTASSAQGFDGGQLDPLFDLTALTASVTVAAFSQPKLTFGIEVVEVGKLDVEVVVKLPQVSTTLTAAFNESGVCPGDRSTTGAKLSSDVGLFVDLNLNADLGDDDNQPSKTFHLFNTTHPLFSKCFPIQIPGLGPKSTAVVSVPSTIALPSVSGGATSMPTIVIPTGTWVLPSGTGAGTGVLPSGTVVLPSGTGVLPSSTGNATLARRYPLLRKKGKRKLLAGDQ